MSTTLILVRHGESDANGKSFFAGQLDIALSKRGQLQAEQTAQYISNNYHIDAIYSSDLKRAYETALPIAKSCNIEINKTERLREIFAGDWQGLSFDDLETRYSEAYAVWLNDIGKAKTTNGESVEALSERIFDIVCEIAEKETGKTVVIVTHATPIRTLICKFRNLGLNKMKDVPWVSNASVSIVSVSDDWVLELEGFDNHLAELKTQFPANV